MGLGSHRRANLVASEYPFGGECTPAQSHTCCHHQNTSKTFELHNGTTYLYLDSIYLQLQFIFSEKYFHIRQNTKERYHVEVEHVRKGKDERRQKGKRGRHVRIRSAYF